MTGLLVDVAGWIGAAALLLAYGLVSSDRLSGRSTGFQLLNLLGAVGLLGNGVWHGAWPSAALNGVWLVIGVAALVRGRSSQPHTSRRRPHVDTGRVDATDVEHLGRCVELARAALEAGSAPFGSVLVGADGQVLHEDHNHDGDGDATQHPELALARWAAQHMTPDARAGATVYTSGEHCAMCAAAHGWVGLGRIVFATSSQQLVQWSQELGMPRAPVRSLSIREVVPDVVVDGPSEELAPRVRELFARRRS